MIVHFKKWNILNDNFHLWLSEFASKFAWQTLPSQAVASEGIPDEDDKIVIWIVTRIVIRLVSELVSELVNGLVIWISKLVNTQWHDFRPKQPVSVIHEHSAFWWVSFEMINLKLSVL